MELFDRLPGRFRIGINASPALIVDDRFGRLLEREDVGQRISIEITEHAHVAEYHAINEALDPLRRRGVRVSIDDTGAGYASFSHVLQLKPDSIKIDRSWLSEIEHDPARRALCTAALLTGRVPRRTRDRRRRRDHRPTRGDHQPWHHPCPGIPARPSKQRP